MPLFETLQAQESSTTATLYPLEDVTDKEWSYREIDGVKEPEIPFEWREVGFVVDIPDVPQMNYVSEKSLKYKGVKGVADPIRVFNPEFIKDVCGVDGHKAIIKDWVNVRMVDENGDEVDMPLDSSARKQLFQIMNKGLFFYTKFMQSYNELMGKVLKDEEDEDEEEKNS